MQQRWRLERHRGRLRLQRRALVVSDKLVPCSLPYLRWPHGMRYLSTTSSADFESHRRPLRWRSHFQWLAMPERCIPSSVMKFTASVTKPSATHVCIRGQIDWKWSSYTLTTLPCVCMTMALVSTRPSRIGGRTDSSDGKGCGSAPLVSEASSRS